MYSDYHLPEDKMREVLQCDRRNHLVIGGYVNTDQHEVVLWTGNLVRFVVPFFEFEPSGDGIAPDFEDFSVIDYGNTLKFGDYEAAVDSLADYYLRAQ